MIGSVSEYDNVKGIQKYSEKNKTKNELTTKEEVYGNSIAKAVQAKKYGIRGEPTSNLPW